MASQITPNSEHDSQILSEKAQSIFQAYSGLGIDDRLALLYYIYEKMGDSITPAAPMVADPELAPMLLGDFYQLSKDEQLAVMQQIVNCEDSEYSRAYGALNANNQLLVWYLWARDMGGSVIGLPSGYQPTQQIQQLLPAIEQLEFQEQISALRQVANSMGYTDIQPIPSQAETGKTTSL